MSKFHFGTVKVSTGPVKGSISKVKVSSKLSTNFQFISSWKYIYIYIYVYVSVFSKKIAKKRLKSTNIAHAIPIFVYPYLCHVTATFDRESIPTQGQQA